MPRPNRIEYPGAWYYVVNHGEESKQIFKDDLDYQIFLDLLEETSQIFSLKIHAYSLLKDRYYLLLHTPKGELSRAMRHINGIYTQKNNKRWSTDGAVFSGRYRAILIDPKEYLVPILTHIHSRPVIYREAQKAANHQWTSHRAYLKDKERPSWLITQKITRSLGFLRPLALARLNSLVSRGPEKSFLTALEKAKSVLGGEEFKKSIQKHEKTKKQKSGISISNKKIRINTAKEVLDFVSSTYQVPVTDIKKSQSGIQNEARSMAVYQLRTLAGLSQKEIARQLGSKNPYTVAKVLERFNTKKAANADLQIKTEKILADLEEKIGSLN